ncbi:MAG: hypothetical protein FJY56_14350 [Betaproteobacteria bacterium]|nr:hypothetical protein [Betaproteobacteria bacterium]
MELIDNINRLLGDDLKQSVRPGAKLRVAASCFSIYAFEALKGELEKIDLLQFIFTSPTFVPGEVVDKLRREHREFHIPKLERERSLYGSDFEVRLRNELTQKAIAKECADWIRRKAVFRSNRGEAPMQQFAAVSADQIESVYLPLRGFTAVDLGYEKGNAVSSFVNRIDEQPMTGTYLALFDQIWQDADKLEDVTEKLCEHIASVYQENSPERIYFLMLYNIFSEFLEYVTADVLPNDRTGYQDSLVWKKLYNFQRDAANGVINKLETYNGCILADSVGLGKTFTALAVIKYYELRNKSVLVLCPKKLADNWLTYKGNLTINIFVKDRFGYDVLCHTDLLRESGESLGLPLNRVNWGNYDLVVIDESHNFRNNDAYSDRETRYQRLLNRQPSVAHLLACPFKTGRMRFCPHRFESHPAQGTQLTRHAVAEILKGLNAAVFSQFRTNPESFIAEAVRHINEQKAAVIIEHLAYDPVEEKFDLDIFTLGQAKQDFSKAGEKLTRHIYDYVVTDSKVEREFVKELDSSGEVVVYAKLPRGFQIPTPVGDYNPDWAITFKEGVVKHVYFVAETKGSMSSLELREIEKTKIRCARKFFEEMNLRFAPENVKYDVVDSFGKLMQIVS